MAADTWLPPPASADADDGRVDPQLVSRDVHLLADANAAVFGTLRQSADRGQVLSEVAVSGEYATMRRAYEGFRGDAHAVPTWAPDLPQPGDANRFRNNFASIVAQWQQAGAHADLHRYYGQFEPETGELDHARALIYDGRRFLGYVALLRGDGRKFTAAECRQLNHALLPTLKSRLLAREALAAELAGRSEALMCTAAGRVEFASERARGWLSRARLSAIESHVRRADKLPSECSYAVLDNVQLRIVRTLGDGATRYLVLLSDTRAFERSPLSDLSARQVQIGEFAAAGATATEIAAELSLSPHTVRQHLKVVYRELGVRNRVELASVFDR